MTGDVVILEGPDAVLLVLPEVGNLVAAVAGRPRHRDLLGRRIPTIIERGFSRSRKQRIKL